MKAFVKRLLLAAALWAAAGIWPNFLTAAKPEISGLNPAGGQIGQTVEVDVGGKLGSAPVEVWCDRENVSAKATEDGKKLSITISPEARPGICWLRAWNKEGASSLRPFIVGRLPEVQETEPNETLSTAQAVDAAGCVINGKLHKSGELDTFQVSLIQGQMLVADVLANQVLQSPMDAVLQVASAKGFVLAHADDSPRLDPRLAFTAPEDGDYFIRIFAFPETPTSSIRYAGGGNFIYRLTLTTGPYVNHAWPLAVAKNEAAPLELRGWNLAAEEPAVALPASEDSPLGHINFPTAVPFRLVAVDHPSLTEGATPDEGKPLKLPVSISGQIQQADEIDRYQVSAKKGETWEVRVESAGLGFPLDPVLEIRDAQGKSLKEVDDKSRGEADAEYTWKVPADGIYEIWVTDRFQHGGRNYAYLLSVEKPQPSFQLSVETDAFTLTKDKDLEIPVKVARQDGFSDKIEVKVAGLPEGITAEAVVSEPKGDSAKSVKLKIAAKGDTPFHGPVWIEGQAGELEGRAATPQAAASPAAGHVWLSYEPKK